LTSSKKVLSTPQAGEQSRKKGSGEKSSGLFYFCFSRLLMRQSWEKERLMSQCSDCGDSARAVDAAGNDLQKPDTSIEVSLSSINTDKEA
jgi:hypothetical protein